LGYGTEPGLELGSLPAQDLSPGQQIELLDATISILESRKKLVSGGMSQVSVKALDALYTMILVLERREAALATGIEELSADISRQEQEIADRRPELECLVEARDRAQEGYGSLLTEIEQAGLTHQAKVITSAAEPSGPIRPSWVDWVQNLTVAGVLGLVVGGITARAVERSGFTLGEVPEMEEIGHQEEWE